MDKRMIGLLAGLVLAGMMVWGCGQQGQNLTSSTTYEGLLISPEAASLSVGETQAFTINGMQLKSSSIASTLTWVVIGDVGTIDANGLFTATSPGEGTIEVRSDSLIGRATVIVEGGQVKTISGKVKNIFIADGVVSSAVVMAVEKITKSNSDGSYQLLGVPLTAEVISAAAPGTVSTTIQSTGEAANIPMGYPLQWNSGSYPTETTLIKGRLVDGRGNPLSSVSCSAVLWNSNYSVNYGGYSGADGRFSISLSVPQNVESLIGYISVMKETIASSAVMGSGVYKGAMKEITVQRGVTLEVGDIVVEGAVATISGTISVPNGYNLNDVECGIQLSSTGLMSLASVYRWSGISGNHYTLRVPATPSGKTYFISATATKGNNTISKYAHDLTFAGGNATCDLALPSDFSLVSPTSGQTDVSNTPKFEWSSLGDGYTYMVLVGNNYGAKWWGFTNAISLEYPSFPVGSGGEAGNLISGQSYLLQIIGLKLPDINLADIEFDDFYRYTDSVQLSSTMFTVGSASTSGIKSFDARGTEGFDRWAKDFLKRLGIRTTED
jgi:hypothetical protein